MRPEKIDWEQRYQTKETPWDSGKPSEELMRVLSERKIRPGRVLEIGCGTGTNAIYLAQQGFEVTATDLSATAIAAAIEKGQSSGVSVRFQQADFLAEANFGSPFPFVFDRGVYHVLRTVNRKAFCESLAKNTEVGALYLTLAGNANDPAPPENGPPRVRCDELATELEPYFQVVQIREFHFDGVVIEGTPVRPLGWSALFRRIS